MSTMTMQPPRLAPRRTARHALPLAMALAAAALAGPAAAQDGLVCDTTLNQSPIDIVNPRADAAMGAITTRYVTGPGRLLNDAGHSLKVEVDGPPSVLTVGTTAYTLEQFHTHWPSEHHVAADSFAAEVHYVHVDAAGNPAAVLGTFIRQGAHNPAWDELLRLLPRPGVPGEVPLRRVDVRALVDVRELDRERIFRYAGSLTTNPTCPGIAWMVRERPIELSAAQLDTLRSKTSHYARPVQPLRDRVIRYVPPRP
jgi:carbonic anhydrase